MRWTAVRSVLGWGVSVATVAAIAGRAPIAEAHQFEHPKILRVGVQRDKLVVSVTYDVNPGDESRSVRSLFDRDANGKLDDEEQKAIARFLEETAMLWLQISIDGAPVKLEKVSASPNRLNAPRESSDSLGIAILFQAALPAKDALAIAIVDRDKDRQKHVPLTVDLAADWEVMFASQGELYPKARQIQRIGLRAEVPLELRLRRAG
jgi:hypothetical protein